MGDRLHLCFPSTLFASDSCSLDGVILDPADRDRNPMPAAGVQSNPRALRSPRPGPGDRRSLVDRARQGGWIGSVRRGGEASRMGARRFLRGRRMAPSCSRYPFGSPIPPEGRLARPSVSPGQTSGAVHPFTGESEASRSVTDGTAAWFEPHLAGRW